MTIKHLFKAIIENPWVQVLLAIFIMVTSAMDIVADITHLRKEHGLLLIGFLMLLKSIVESYDHVKKGSASLKAASLNLKAPQKIR